MKKIKPMTLAKRTTPPTTPPAIPPFAAVESPSLEVEVSVGVGTRLLGGTIWEDRVEDRVNVKDAVGLSETETEVDDGEN